MNRIRIKLKAYDHVLLDKSTEKIVKTAKNTGALVLGPIPLPTKKTIITVNKSVFVDKKSREQFQIKSLEFQQGLETFLRDQQVAYERISTADDLSDWTPNLRGHRFQR